MQALKTLSNKIETNESGCVQSIVRVKNGFKNIKDWNHVENCNYTDLKLNIVIFNAETNESMICELQLSVFVDLILLFAILILFFPFSFLFVLHVGMVCMHQFLAYFIN